MRDRDSLSMTSLSAVESTVAVVPAYRAASTICRVVTGVLDYVDRVVVVDDACPQRSGDLVKRTFVGDDRVTVIERAVNGGVGAAMISGMQVALQLGCDIIVKVDADDQMDPSYIPDMKAVLRKYPVVDLVKGNRFADTLVLSKMPIARLFGNSVLTLLVKLSSGFWTIVDPTNGYIGLKAETARRLIHANVAKRYFFEIDLLCSLGLHRDVIAELEMPARYAGEHSSLSIPVVISSFPLKLLARFLRRIVIQYVVIEINVGSLCGALGITLLVSGTTFGLYQWRQSAASGIPRATGTVILALLLFVIGFQLSLQAVLFDINASSRSIKVRPERRA